jgi:hypothetical protein
MASRPASATPNPGLITVDRAGQLAARSAAVRRARRDRRLADELERKAGRLLSRAAELRRRVVEDLVATGARDD